MPPGDPVDDAILAGLRPALEVGLEHARSMAATDAAALPGPLRPVVRMRGIPQQSLRVLRSVLDQDDDFRVAVASEAPDGDELAWMWLHRTPGWQWRLEALVTEARHGALLSEESRRRADAERRRDQAEHERAVAEAERGDAMERADRLAADVRRLDADLAAALEELGAARADRDDLSGRAASAGRRAQQAEATLGRERTRWREERARWREAQDSLPAGQAAPSAAGVGGDGGRAIDIEAARDAVRAAAEALGLAPVAPPTGRNDIRPVPARRRPVRLGRGIHAESPEGVLALLAHDGIVVFVDGYNVAKRAWPAIAVDLQRKRLVGCLTALCARTGGTLEVVFDGADVDPLPPRSADDPVQVRFSPPGVEADDEIIDRVAALDPTVPVAVVSSDRRVQRGAAEHGANVIDADALISTFR